MKKCGNCNLCCVLLDVPELNKPANTPCSHLCRGKCSIHPAITNSPDERPKICGDFSCLWITNPEMPRRFRPDECGIILTENIEGTRENRRTTLNLVCRSRKDFDSEDGQLMVRQLLAQKYILIVKIPGAPEFPMTV